MVDFTEAKAVPAFPDVRTVMPHFQPILALDTRRIVGYEVLGRQCTPDGIVSLGPFLSDARVPVENQMRIDRLLREEAFRKLGAVRDRQPMLFVNLKPSRIQRMYRETGELYTLQLLDRYGIDPAKVVIEITEEAYSGPMGELREIIDIYRRKGCLIAIDDVGTGFNSADRIAHIQPNLLKVDIHMMKQSASHSGYLGVLRSFSTLAEQIGASLLIEGVETGDDLQRAIQIGARYVQGYLFAPAEQEFREPDAFAGVVEAGLKEHLQTIGQVEVYWRELGDRIMEELDISGFADLTDGVEESGSMLPDTADLHDAAMERMLAKVPASCIRVYLCRADGVQLSSNYRRWNGAWRKEPEYRGANWSWRPYFLSDLLLLRGPLRASVSRTYADLDSRRWIRTLSVAVTAEAMLFMDIADPNARHQELSQS